MAAVRINATIRFSSTVLLMSLTKLQAAPKWYTPIMHSEGRTMKGKIIDSIILPFIVVPYSQKKAGTNPGLLAIGKLCVSPILRL